MSEHGVVAAVSASRVRSTVEHICNEMPSRLAGSENAKRMAEFARDSLREGGVGAEVHEINGLVSFPGKAELRVLEPIHWEIPANTLGHSTLTPAEGVTAELIDVFSGAARDYEGKSAAGKLTLSELSYHPARHEKQRIAAMMHAAGCVMMNWGHPENDAIPFGSVKPAWGNPTPDTWKNEMATVPCVGIARTSGLRLREMIRNGPVRVSLKTDVDNRWTPVHVTVGKLESPAGSDFVIVGGHQDSWYGPQATDNAAGNACTLELARVFSQHRDELRRGLVFGFWTGHETGTMVGSSWYVDQHWAELRDHAVAYLQIDQPACAGTTIWSTTSNAELKRFHQAIERRMLGQRPTSWRRAIKIGDASFFGLGVPMLTALGAFTEAELKASALANLGWWHHSIYNTLDKLDWQYMQLHLAVYAAYLWELCTAPVLPFEFAAVADQFIERLRELDQEGVDIGLESAARTAQDFRVAAVRFDEIAKEWRQRYDSDRALDCAPADLLNDCIKRLSRTLIPVASTSKGTYGHDPYGYTPQTTMIPALYDVPRLGQLAAGSEEAQMLRTQLVRDRNRVADALADASREISATLRAVA